MISTTKAQTYWGAALVLFGLSLAATIPHHASAAESFIRPLSGPTVLRFGAKYIDAGGRSRRHYGIDISAAEGTPVRAASKGRVVFAGNTPNGACVSIAHPGAVKTTYLPLKQIKVATGDVVEAGSLIGYVGGPGDPSGDNPHVHIGAIFAGEYIDPESLFRGEFRPDLSKVIRRGNIPPVASASWLMPPAAAVVVNIPGFFSWLWDHAVSFVGLIFVVTDSAWSWIHSVTFNGFSFLREKLTSFSRNRWASTFGVMGYFRHRSSLNAVPGPAARVFDPSGDAEGPGCAITIDLTSLPARIEVFNDDGDSVWVFEEWQARGREAVWTGVDQMGRIVPNGTYTVIVEYADSTEGFLAEARWHL